MKKTVAFICIIAIFLTLFIFSSSQEFSLERLVQMISDFGAWRKSNPFAFALIFFAAYVGVAAFSLPFAVWMTLAAGAFFGFWWGLAIASFAASIGAVIAFLASRYFLSDWVKRRLGDRAKTIQDGIDRDGAFYLFTLRLIPVVPFFAVNLLMGLTKMRVFVFYAISQIGMIPAGAVYVNAGTQLGQIDSLSGIVSPGLLLSFILLGIFPWIARIIINQVKKRRVYKGYKKPSSFDRNIVVIGGGAAGLVSAYIGSAVKAKVTLVEGHKMGGDCLNYGCVPSKALIKSAKLAYQIQHADHYGLSSTTPTFEFKRVMERVQNVVKTIEPHDSVERYEKLGVDVRQGYAKIIDPWRVEITAADGTRETLTTKSIIIATGAAPFVPLIRGIDRVDYLTSDTLWEHMAKQSAPPKRLVVLGGGPIGTELTQAFARLGSSVTQVEMAPRILNREDEEVSQLVTASLERDGVQILTNHRAVEFGVEKGEKWIDLETGANKVRLYFDEVIVAVGRQARLNGYGLEELGVPTNHTIETDAYLQTIYPNIFAAGDVAGPYQFTHTASHQAWYAVVNALFGNFKRFKVDYRVIPWATFTDPEVARVGLSEAEAREKNIAYEITRYGLDDLDRAIADSADYGFVKVLTPPGKDKILGVTIVGEHAGDLIAEFVFAMKHKLGLNKILGTIHIYPTLAEMNKYAAGEWRRAHVNEHLLGILNRYHEWRRK